MILKFSFWEKSVGVFILVTFLSFVGAVVLVGRGQNWFRNHVIYYTTYDEGYNLVPGVKVKLLRADIGQVTNVELTDQNKVRVTMRILADYSSRIRADSKAAIESPTIIGSEYINIIPGSPTSLQIDPGGDIPSKGLKKISDYLEEFEVEHKLLVLEEIMENVASIADQLESPNGGLFGTLSNLEKISGSVAKGEGSIGKLVQGEEIYNRIIKDLDAVEKILETVQSALNSTDTASSHAKDMAAEVKTRLPETMNQLQIILERINSISANLEKAMNEAPEISFEARQGMRQVNQILESVKKNFLIRSNLPQQPAPETHGVEIRGD